MNILLKISLITILLFSMTGCASYFSYQSSKYELKKDVIFASGDQKAMKAFLVDGGAGVAVDVDNLDALFQHPWRQIGAGLLDLLSLYGVYAGSKGVKVTLEFERIE